ncbi:IS66 family transposase, partial [Teredinibacter turnerae]|uniref:IS66 family transposase n=1 Tax=Teredinibacter turnerae TaxID=2426 RepID=UPI000379FFBE
MEIDELTKKIASLEAHNKQLKQENDFLREQFNLARHRRFEASSEKCSVQSSLFNEPETEVDEPIEAAADEAVEESRAESRPKAKPKRKPLPKDLPRETHIIDIADEEKICPCCKGELHQFGEETSEQLEYIPATVKLIETVRPKYACRTCEHNNTHTPIKIADVPASPIPKSMATPSLLAQVIIQKYQFALPLYSQEALFKQLDIELSRKTLATWMIRCADLFKPVIERLKDTLLTQSVIHADETPLKVINDGKQKSYLWVYCTGTDSPNTPGPHRNIVLYDYHPSRAATCPKDFLGNYSGYLQVDGYAGYNDLDAELAGCMAHARRKFVEAQRAQPKGKTGRADVAINHFRDLYVSANPTPPYTRLAFQGNKASTSSMLCALGSS